MLAFGDLSQNGACGSGPIQPRLGLLVQQYQSMGLDPEKMRMLDACQTEGSLLCRFWLRLSVSCQTTDAVLGLLGRAIFVAWLKSSVLPFAAQGFNDGVDSRMGPSQGCGTPDVCKKKLALCYERCCHRKFSIVYIIPFCACPMSQLHPHLQRKRWVPPML